jgi:eukaryotic-like serine/threonine-protein kinase
MLKTPDLVGRALDDRYELRVAIGEGAFGRVYEGLDRRLARTVAVKVIKPWWAEDDAWVERFQREAQLLARVSDPGIVQVFDIGHAEEGPYYVAELIDGESLSERLLRGAIAPAEARAIAEQLARALGSAHAQGVVHCDVKPANVMITSGGRVKVGDFGIARLAGGTSQAPSSTIAGTPRYMSPEQARGQPTTAATDVYSAGVVLYEMLAGKPPFEHGSPVELGLRHLQDRPAPLPTSVPPGLREVVAQALAKDPAARYADGAAMAVALAAVDLSDAAPTAARVASVTRRVPRRATGALAEEDAHASEPAVGVAAAADTAETKVITDTPTIDLAAARVAAAAPTSVAAKPPTPPRSPGTRRPRGAGASDGPPRRRLVLAAVLVALGIAAALLVLLTGTAAKTTVPHLRGLPLNGVTARAQHNHVHPEFSKRHSEAAAGLAIAQSPAAGTRVDAGSNVHVVLSAGPPPVHVPGVVGQSSSSAEEEIASAGLRYGLTPVSAPGSSAGQVITQSPDASTAVPRGSTVDLNVAEAPRWRPLTTFSGIDDGHSVPFQIRGKQWRVRYSMSYVGTCLLIFTCFGPSAEARDLHDNSTFGGFELGEGSSQTHVFADGPGLYRLEVNGGHDSARWSMTVEDYY